MECRAFLKLHYMRKHPVLSTGPLNSRGFHSICSRLQYNSLMSKEKSKDFICLYPYLITGFPEGEAYFYLKIRKNTKSWTIQGWSLELVFGFHIHKKDEALLQAIRNTLQGIGKITNNGKKAVQLQISSIKDLKILISHFDKYPLITQKFADYLFFFSGSEGGAAHFWKKKKKINKLLIWFL